MSLPQINKPEAASPRRPHARGTQNEPLQRNRKPFNAALRKAFDDASGPLKHQHRELAPHTPEKPNIPAAKRHPLGAENHPRKPHAEPDRSNLRKQDHAQRSRSHPSSVNHREDAASESRSDTMRAAETEASDNARETETERNREERAREENARQEQTRQDAADHHEPGNARQLDDEPAEENEHDQLREQQLLSATHAAIMATMGAHHHASAAKAPTTTETGRTNNGTDRLRHHASKAQLENAQALDRKNAEQASNDDLSSEEELSNNEDELLSQKLESSNAESGGTTIKPFELGAEIGNGARIGSAAIDGLSPHSASKSRSASPSSRVNSRASTPDADELTRLARARRQQAAMKVVNRMTLRHGAHADIDVPELGRIRIAARSIAGEIDVNLRAAGDDALAVLHSASSTLEADLRNSSIELRNLDIEKDLLPQDEEEFEQADARDAESKEETDHEATDESRNSSLNGGQTTKDPKQVRIVL